MRGAGVKRLFPGRSVACSDVRGSGGSRTDAIFRTCAVLSGYHRRPAAYHGAGFPRPCRPVRCGSPPVATVCARFDGMGRRFRQAPRPSNPRCRRLQVGPLRVSRPGILAGDRAKPVSVQAGPPMPRKAGGRLKRPALRLREPSLQPQAPSLHLRAPSLLLQAPSLQLKAPSLATPRPILAAPGSTVAAPRSVAGASGVHRRCPARHR